MLRVSTEVDRTRSISDRITRSEGVQHRMWTAAEQAKTNRGDLLYTVASLARDFAKKGGVGPQAQESRLRQAFRRRDVSRRASSVLQVQDCR